MRFRGVQVLAEGDPRPEDVTAGDPSAYVLKGGFAARFLAGAVLIGAALVALAASGHVATRDLPILSVGVIIVAGLAWFVSRLSRLVNIAVGPLGIYLRDQNGTAAVHPWRDVRSVRIFTLLQTTSGNRRHTRTLAVALQLTDVARARQRAADRALIEDMTAELPPELSRIVGAQWDAEVSEREANARIVARPYVPVDRIRLRRRALEATVTRYAPGVDVLDGPVVDLTTRWGDVLTGGRLIRGIARSWAHRKPPADPGRTRGA